MTVISEPPRPRDRRHLYFYRRSVRLSCRMSAKHRENKWDQWSGSVTLKSGRFLHLSVGRAHVDAAVFVVYTVFYLGHENHFWRLIMFSLWFTFVVWLALNFKPGSSPASRLVTFRCSSFELATDIMDEPAELWTFSLVWFRCNKTPVIYWFRCILTIKQMLPVNHS